MNLEINDEDQASAIVQGLEKAEQKMLLKALIEDIPEELFAEALGECGYEVQSND